MSRLRAVSQIFTEKLLVDDSNDKIFVGKNEIGKTTAGVPSFITNELDEMTLKVSHFYDEIKFPNFDGLEDYASIYDKGVSNAFTKMLDQEINWTSKILELGCGTGQLSLFLARGNREVHGVDISAGSLDMAEEFRKRNDVHNAFFFQMDVFNLAYMEDSFDVVISNGVLHHTINLKKHLGVYVMCLSLGVTFVSACTIDMAESLLTLSNFSVFCLKTT